MKTKLLLLIFVSVLFTPQLSINAKAVDLDVDVTVCYPSKTYTTYDSFEELYTVMKNGELYKVFNDNKVTDELGDVMYTPSVWAGKITRISRDYYSMSIDYSKGIRLDFNSDNRLETRNTEEIEYWKTKSDEIREINGHNVYMDIDSYPESISYQCAWIQDNQLFYLNSSDELSKDKIFAFCDVKKITMEELIKEEAKIRKPVIRGTGVSLRKSANILSKRIKILKNETLVEILSKDNGWYKIKIGNNVGYVEEKFIVYEG